MTTETKTLGVLLDRCLQAISDLEAYTSDSSDVTMLLEAQPKVAELGQIVKIVTGGIDTSLRLAVAQGGGAVFLPDGRTMSVGKGEAVRTLRPDTNRIIDTRIIRKALAEAEGEAAPAIEAAIKMTRDLYVAATALPKWTPLKALGFNSWSDVVDEDNKPGKLEVQ